MIEPMDYQAVSALGTLPRTAALAKSREDSLQILAEATDCAIDAPFLIDEIEPLPARTRDIVARRSDGIDPLYLARLNDVLVTGHRDLHTLDGLYLTDLRTQGGLHSLPSGLVADQRGGWLKPVGSVAPELVDETAGFLFFHEASGDNHSHWLIQTLPQLHYFERAGVRPKKLVVQPNIRPYQREALAALGYDEKSLLLRRPDQPIIFRELYVGYVDAELGPDLTIHDRLRDHFAAPAPGSPAKLFISRQDARGIRRFLNEDRLIERLRKMGFHIVIPGQLSQREEITLFRHARVVVGALGAGLYNCLFTDPGATIVALSDPHYVMAWLQQVATYRQHRYGWMFGVSFDSIEPVYSGTHNNWIIDIDRVCDALAGL